MTQGKSYHFSPKLQAWAKCPAQIKCKLGTDHINEQAYQTYRDIAAQEATLLNTKLGHAEIGYIYSKTRLDAAEIRDTLKELRNEGSALDDPEAEEVRTFIEQERFKVTHDPTIAAREKREILKNLRQAEKDLDQMEVTGGIFHAWKNGMTASLKKIQRPLMAAGLIGVVAFTASGCAGNTMGEEATPPKDQGTEQVVEPATNENCGDEVHGDVIDGELAKGPYGEYCAVKLPADSPAYKFDKTKVQQAVWDAGYTEAELESAQKDAVDYYVQQIIDNPVAGELTDGPDTIEWMKKELPKHLDEAKASQIIADYATPQSYAKYMFPTNGVIPPLAHDGSSRIDKTSLSVGVMYMMHVNKTNEDLVIVPITSTTTYKLKDEASYVTWKVDSSDLIDRSITEEEAKSSVTITDKNAPLKADVVNETTLGFNKTSIQKENSIRGSSYLWTIDGTVAYN